MDLRGMPRLPVNKQEATGQQHASERDRPRLLACLNIFRMKEKSLKSLNGNVLYT